MLLYVFIHQYLTLNNKCSKNNALPRSSHVSYIEPAGRKHPRVVVKEFWYSHTIRIPLDAVIHFTEGSKPLVAFLDVFSQF